MKKKNLDEVVQALIDRPPIDSEDYATVIDDIMHDLSDSDARIAVSTAQRILREQAARDFNEAAALEAEWHRRKAATEAANDD